MKNKITVGLIALAIIAIAAILWLLRDLEGLTALLFLATAAIALNAYRELSWSNKIAENTADLVLLICSSCFACYGYSAY